MIVYALACDGGHRFDSWFRDSSAFDDQLATGHVACPVCHSVEVAKAIMAPAVVGGRRPVAPHPSERPVSEIPSTETSENVALLDERSRELRALVRKVRGELLAEGHDVGREFATEARRIHDGDAPARQIYGQASIAEARDLLDDGIIVLPLPNVPEELN